MITSKAKTIVLASDANSAAQNCTFFQILAEAAVRERGGSDGGGSILVCRL